MSTHLSAIVELARASRGFADSRTRAGVVSMSRCWWRVKTTRHIDAFRARRRTPRRRARRANMGITFAKLFQRLFSKKEMRILMVRRVARDARRGRTRREIVRDKMDVQTESGRRARAGVARALGGCVDIRHIGRARRTARDRRARDVGGGRSRAGDGEDPGAGRARRRDAGKETRNAKTRARSTKERRD